MDSSIPMARTRAFTGCARSDCCMGTILHLLGASRSVRTSGKLDGCTSSISYVLGQVFDSDSPEKYSRSPASLMKLSKSDTLEATDWSLICRTQEEHQAFTRCSFTTFLNFWPQEL